MKKYVEAILRIMTTIMEYVIAALLAAGVIVMMWQLAYKLGNLPNLAKYPNYNDLITVCFNMIIGVELIRMLYMHTPMTVFEVLLFAIARQVIMSHNEPVNTLIGVMSIAILFATRKFLFVAFDQNEKVIFRSSQKVKYVNRILHADIPYENSETLKELMLRKMDEYDIEIGGDACVYLQNYALRVAKIKDGNIHKIEVIRSIQ